MIDSNVRECNIFNACINEMGLNFNSYKLRNTDDLRLNSYVTEVSESCNAKRFMGSGVDFSPGQALLKSIAESIERYFLHSPRKNLVTNKLLKANASHMPEHIWPTFLDGQLSHNDFNYKKYKVNKVDDWVIMHNLVTNKEMLFPASLVWLSYFKDRFSPGVSSGTACHSMKEQAILSSLYEIIERDAFTILWESMAMPPVIELSSIPFSKEVNYLIEKLLNKQFSVKIIDITTDLDIAVYCVVIYSTYARKPNVCLGAACNLDRLTAVSKAMIEAYQTWCWMCDEIKKDNISFRKCLFSLRNPSEMIFHPLLYIFKDARKYCEFMLTNNKITQWKNDVNNTVTDNPLQKILAMIQKIGYQAYYLDIGSNITKSFSLSVIRVLIPGMVPLSIGFNGKHYANSRLKNIPRIMKWQTYNNDLFNPYPHPFP